MARWTIALLQRLDPGKRLVVAVHLLYASIVLGVASVVLLATNGYERVLMAISWGAISITCVDVILTADVRDNEDKPS